MRVEKWQALGNDYLIVDRADLAFELSPARVQRICAAHFGLGSDGILLLERAGGGEAGVAGSLRIFNPDGSEAELSGNGAREAALYMHAHGWSAGEDTFLIATAAGVVRPEVLPEDRCRMAMGHASVSSKDFPSGPADGRGELETAGVRFQFQHISIGNPQCAMKVGSPAELEALDLRVLGPGVEASKLFPNRTNVSWFAEVGADRIRARIFERGVGETLASGTGAAGAAIAFALATGVGRRTIIVEMEGGELEVLVGDDLQISQSGWAVPVYSAVLSEHLLATLRSL